MSRDLPVEIWRDVLLYLPRTDQKSFRLASKSTAGLATPLLFETVLFDLEPSGCDGLAGIAQSVHLRGHVRTLQLQRRRGIIRFDDFRTWQTANIHEYEPWWPEPEPVQPSLHTGLLSEEEWTKLSEEQRRRLYHLYEADITTQDRSLRELARATSDWLLDDSNLGQFLPLQPPTACPTLSQFITAAAALTTVQKFVHIPAFQTDEWGRTWRCVEFHPTALVEPGWGDDPHAEALQVFIALLGVLAAPNALCSIELYTQGPAFWTMHHLRRLLSWDKTLFGPESLTGAADSEYGMRYELEEWLETYGGHQSGLYRITNLTRIVGEMERRFSRLTQLTYYIDTM
jgi:hypothetical protein